MQLLVANYWPTSSFCSVSVRFRSFKLPPVSVDVEKCFMSVLKKNELGAMISADSQELKITFVNCYCFERYT